MTELLALHAVRLRGFVNSADAAARFDLDPESTDELLLDQQAYGRVSWSEFGESAGWSLTPRGREHGEQLLATQLDSAGDDARAAVEAQYAAFLPLNDRLRAAITDWQIRPSPTDPVAPNRHDDAVWDAAVRSTLAELSRGLRPIVESLATLLPRFAGYDRRFARAVDRVSEGDREWVDGVGIDSCHTVWFELHEDLLATLGLARGA